MVACTAKQALMLEMIWPLPWEVSVPARGGWFGVSAGDVGGVYGASQR